MISIPFWNLIPIRDTTLASCLKVNQILSLYSPIPDTDYYSSYMRVPIFFNERDAGFYNTPAIVNNMSKLKRIATDEKHL